MPEQNFPFMNQGGQPQSGAGQPQNNPSDGNLGTGEVETPLAQPPKFDVRTMASDIASVQSGEEQPKPYTPPTPTPDIPPMSGMGMPPADMATMPADEIKKEETFELPQVGETTGKEAVSMPPASAQEIKTETASAKEAEAKPASPMMKKGVFISAVAAIAVIGIAAVVYFFVYPKFFGGTAEETAQAPITTMPAPVPETIPEPTAEVIVPPVVEQVVEQPAAPETTPTEEQYVSILKTAANETAESKLAEVSLTAIKALAQFTTATTPTLKEYALKTAEGKLAMINQVLAVFIPSVFNEEMRANFGKGGLLSYADDKGTWLIIVAQLKDGVALADVQNKISALESNADLENLFLVDSGEATTWKSGQAEGVTTRYLSYGLAGAGINYGWLDNKLIIAGSYGAFKEAVKRLK